MRISDWSSDVCSSDLMCEPETVLAWRVRIQRRVGVAVVVAMLGRPPQGAGLQRGLRDPRQHKLEHATGLVGLVREVAVIAGGDAEDAHEVQRHAQCERAPADRSEEHTSELQSLMRISYAVFCLKKKKNQNNKRIHIS